MRRAALLLIFCVPGARAEQAPVAVSTPAAAPAPDDIGKRAIHILEAASVGSNFETRALAMAAWGQIGNPAAKPLLERALKDRNVYVRIEAATALQKTGFSDEAFAALKAIAQGAPKPAKTTADEMRNLARDKARILAIERLSDFGGEQAVSFFEMTLKDPSGAVRDATAAALAKMGLDEFSAQFIEAMKSRDEAVRASATRSLGQIGGTSVSPVMRDAADDKAVSVRVEAMRAMTNFSGPDAASLLARGLNDSDDRVRARALASLSQLTDDDSKDLLLQIEKNKPTAETELKAMAGLARRGEPPAYDIVNDALHEKDSDLRALALDVLRASDDDGVLPLLDAVMSGDPDPSLRVQAAGLVLKRLRHRRQP